MRPIPLLILNQNCTYNKVTRDAWGDETNTEYTIENVYFEPSDALIKNAENEEFKASTLMIFDNVNSTMKLSGNKITPVFVEDDIIVFNDRNYRLLKIDIVYQAYTDAIHHYELYLQ